MTVSPYGSMSIFTTGFPLSRPMSSIAPLVRSVHDV